MTSGHVAEVTFTAGANVSTETYVCEPSVVLGCAAAAQVQIRRANAAGDGYVALRRRIDGQDLQIDMDAKVRLKTVVERHHQNRHLQRGTGILRYIMGRHFGIIFKTF